MAQPVKCIRAFANVEQIEDCQARIKVNESEFSSLSRVLALSGNTVRLKILYLLSTEQELCPCDISDILQMSVQAISQHLRKLRDADMVKFRKEGQTIFYSLKTDHLNVIEPLFQHILKQQIAV